MMPSWNDIPPFENLGGGHIVMDIAPHDGCIQCGHWDWLPAVVNTMDRQDLLTGKPLKTWSARSDCKKCDTQTLWTLNPDKPYPSTK